MSRLYDLQLTIIGHEPTKAHQIRKAANQQWPALKANWDGDQEVITSSGQESCVGGKGARQLVERLAVAIWQANGDFCRIVAQTTCLDDLPYETHVLDKIDYDQSMASRKGTA
jgi:hypothetical protein